MLTTTSRGNRTRGALALLALDTLLSAVLFPFVVKVRRELEAWIMVPVAQAPDQDAPFVAILVPARNEARSIECCVRSLLDQAYPRDRFEVVVVDDRSDDATPDILARLAGECPGLRVVESHALPLGWKGKCWALHQAAQHVDPRAELLVFTDADTVHDRRMLPSVVGFAREHAVDMLSLATGQELGSLAEHLLMPTILGMTLGTNGTVSEVNDPAKPAIAKANGQFLLFRAASYRALGGHESVRDEIVEDFELARHAKRSGYRFLFADGRHLVQTRMYVGLAEIWHGFSKNAYDTARKGPGGVTGALIALFLAGVAPVVLPALGMRRYLRSGGTLNWLLATQSAAQAAGTAVLGMSFARATGTRAAYGLAFPIGMLFLCGVVANSAWRTLSGRGVVWKGRTY